MDSEEVFERDVQSNYAASLKVSSTAPTRLSRPIQERLYRTSKLFCMGQFVESDESVKFLTTLSVLCCISVFAWSSKGPKGPTGFGAHVNVQAIHHGIRRHMTNPKTCVLQELTDAMAHTFTGIGPQHVHVHIVGGHQYTEKDENLRIQGGQPSMSWHVLGAVRAAGFTKINQKMLNVFPGGPLGPSPMCERRLVQDNQRFDVAALHLKTGCIVTHTDHSAESAVPTEMYQVNDKITWTVGNCPLRHVDDPTVYPVKWLLSLVACLCLWAVTDFIYSAGFFVLLVWKLEPSSFTNLSMLVGAAAVGYRTLVAA
ncbi:unnamed protein product [Effrenium voratum]|nr:unnamed protein product [Effrenium voratum]